jgi:murein DD-endopeptidase MepM/ murein hydrolase activator NlpD
MRIPALRAAGALALLLLPTRLATLADQPVRIARAVAPIGPDVFRGIVGRNTNLAALLGDRLSPLGVHRLVEAARPVYDLARITVGRSYELALDPGGLLHAFSYQIDELRTLQVTRKGDALDARLLTRTYDLRDSTVSGAIASSLFAAVTDAGEDDQLALDLAEIFAWDVDFNTELQEGDSFQVAVEKMYLDDRFCRYGRILAAELVRGDKVLRAVRFDGKEARGYYAPDGTPLRKAFLRSPLKFTRISSGFSRARLHPILHEVRPHLGVDYAAPLGTAVQAAGDGRVVEAGWSGGYGRLVRIRHANDFETSYAHLSRINVKSGQRVAQGQAIGAVGATGLATGPHLDYRMLRKGAFVNPLSIQSPRAEPVPTAERTAFAEASAYRLGLLQASAASAGRPSAPSLAESIPVAVAAPPSTPRSLLDAPLPRP